MVKHTGQIVFFNFKYLNYAYLHIVNPPQGVLEKLSLILMVKSDGQTYWSKCFFNFKYLNYEYLHIVDPPQSVLEK